MPFAPSYCGLKLDVPATDKVIVRLDPKNRANDSIATTSYVATDRQP
jgi:hypothetical protein